MNHTNESAPGWKKKILFSPEDVTLFNSSRLLILFEAIKNNSIDSGIDIERISYYDFFSANPLIILSDTDSDKLELEYMGFASQSLDYASSSQQFRTKRAKIKQFLAYLMTKGLVEMKNKDGQIVFSITELGESMARKLDTLYANAYRKSVNIIIKRLHRLTDKRLWQEANKWLEAKHFQIDLLDSFGDIND